MTTTERLSGAGVASLAVAYFLTTYLFASTNVALPAIGTALHTSDGERALLLGAFAATFGTTLILFGRIGDNLGRRKLLIGGLLALAVTAVAAGLAPNAEVLVLLRAVQGVAAAAFAPQVLSTIQASSEGTHRRTAVAVVAAAAGLGFCGGQLVGGALIAFAPAEWGWRMALWSNAIIALIPAAMGGAIPPTRAGRRRPLDPVGAVILSIALLALVFALTLGPTVGWRPWIWVLLVVSAASWFALIRHQSRLENRDGAPLLPPNVFAHRPIRIGLILALLFFAGYGAFVYEYALLTEGPLWLSAWQSGLGLLPFGLAFAVVSVWQPRLHTRLGRLTMPVGATLQAIGLALLAASGAFASDGRWIWIVQLPLIVVGAGQALQFGPLVSTIMGAVPDRIAGLTGGLVSTAQQAALAIGVAVLGGGYVALAQGLSPRMAFSTILVAHVVLATAFVVLALTLEPRRVRSAPPRDADSIANSPRIPVDPLRGT